MRELTSRRWSIAMSRRIELVNRYLRGWLVYFRIADAKGHLER
ncbi:MAG: group II intron reverse transcriptase/maturase, partial [Firmicutes bacterium]|nr:group II intron reverse transcriptase/maturase [Bacillota bacterium]